MTADIDAVVQGAASTDATYGSVVAPMARAEDLGCQVVGEGVETLEEHECLVTLGCDLLQGYLLGRPSVTAIATGS